MIKDIMKKIESNKFSTLLNVTSSFNGFLRAAYEEQATQDLIEELINAPVNTWLVLQRITELSRKEIDTRYENPWDTALTIYVWALSLIDLEIAQTAAAFVVNTENCWWATRFASFLLQKKGLANISSLNASILEKVKEFKEKKEILISEKSTREARAVVNTYCSGKVEVSFLSTSCFKKFSKRTENVLQRFPLIWSDKPYDNSRAHDNSERKECNTSH
jgi:hypothetical protein